MSAEYKNTDPISVAKSAEQDLHSNAAKQGHDGKFGASDTTRESGIDASATAKFPGSTAQYTGREVPLEEGGSIDPATGKPYKAGDFAKGGVGAPEARDQAYAKNHGGEDDVRGNVDGGASLRQTGAK